MSILSAYARSLDPVSKERYLEKLKLHDLQWLDPYAKENVSKFSDLEVEKWPSVSWADVDFYLIHTPGKYTREVVKAYKSTQAWNFVKSGKVHCIRMKKNGDYMMLVGKVAPSQRTSSDLREAWVIVKMSGEVSAAHCTCMAGLGEVCSHVAAILFFVADAVQTYEREPCTSRRQEWSEVKREVKPARIRDIDFAAPKRGSKRKQPTQKTPMSPPKGNLDQLLLLIKDANPKAAVLTLYPTIKSDPEDTDTASEQSDDDKESSQYLPDEMGKLFHFKYRGLNATDLNNLCDQTFHELLVSDIDKVELLEIVTRDQSKNELWHRQRIGRLTASSVFHKIKTMRETTSPVSVIQEIMNYDHSFYCNNLKYGIDNEPKAREQFALTLSSPYSLRKAGLFISNSHPFLGASPDGIINAHGKPYMTVEIKCPSTCANGELIQSLFGKENSFLDKSGFLKKSHMYYTQVQGQLAITGLKSAMFVVWAPNQNLHTQEISFDPLFWQELQDQLVTFFKKYILPELLTRRLDRSINFNENNEILFCKCRTPENGRMVACDNDKCRYIWFHFGCVGLTKKPKGKWYCKECNKA